jgi:hypothetical protein
MNTSIKTSKYISRDNRSCIRISNEEKIQVKSWISNKGVAIRFKKKLYFYNPKNGAPLTKNAPGQYLLVASRQNLGEGFQLKKHDKITHDEPAMHTAFKQRGDEWLGAKVLEYRDESPVYYGGYHARMDILAKLAGNGLRAVELKLTVNMACVLEALGYATAYKIANPGSEIKPIMIFRNASPFFRAIMESHKISWVHIDNNFSVIERKDF